MKKVEENLKVQEISNLKELKTLIADLSNDPNLSDESIIGLTENGDFCISPVMNGNNNINNYNYDSVSYNDKSNYNCDSASYNDKSNYNYNGIKMNKAMNNYSGLIKRSNYDFTSTTTKHQNEMLNDALNKNRNLNDKTSMAIIKAMQESNEMKKAVIAKAVDEINQINDFVTKSIVDTMFEKIANEQTWDKVEMISFINNNSGGTKYDC